MEVSQLCTHPSKSYIIASSSYDNSITLRNIRTKVFIARFAGLVHQFGVYDVQFREDGNELLSSDGSQHIAAWSLKSEDIKDKIKESEDMGSRRYPLIEVDNAAKLTRELHGSEIDSILYFSDDYIISKSAANDIVLWKFGEKQLRIGNNLNFAEHDPVKILKRIRQPDLASIHRTFFRLALDRTRNIVVLTSMREGKFYSFDFADQNAGLQSHIFPKLDSIVRMFDFTPDGKYLIAGTASRKLYLFSIK
jgi:WD40 repeat protein